MSGCKNAEKGTIVYMDNGYMIHKSRFEMGVMKKRNLGFVCAEIILSVYCGQSIRLFYGQ